MQAVLKFHAFVLEVLFDGDRIIYSTCFCAEKAWLYLVLSLA